MAITTVTEPEKAAVTTDAAPRRRRRSPGWSRGATYLALTVGLILTLAPFMWMLLGSFKKT